MSSSWISDLDLQLPEELNLPGASRNVTDVVEVPNCDAGKCGTWLTSTRI